jgi:uncharacterized protein YpuA (DUF1002 family)
MNEDDLKYKTPEKIKEYQKVIEQLKVAHDNLSNCLEGKNRRGILTDISNTIFRIKKEYLND